MLSLRSFQSLFNVDKVTNSVKYARFLNLAIILNDRLLRRQISALLWSQEKEQLFWKYHAVYSFKNGKINFMEYQMQVDNCRIHEKYQTIVTDSLKMNCMKRVLLMKKGDVMLKY